MWLGTATARERRAESTDKSRCLTGLKFLEQVVKTFHDPKVRAAVRAAPRRAALHSALASERSRVRQSTSASEERDRRQTFANAPNDMRCWGEATIPRHRG